MKHEILQEPILLSNNIEASIIRPTKSFLRELEPIFNRDTTRFNVVILILKMQNDILGNQQQEERDEHLDFVMSVGKELKEVFHHQYYVDYCDPVSGLIIGSNSNNVYADANGCERLLKMDVVSIGCCKLVSHKKWGTNIYPFTLFTTAPPEKILKELRPIINKTFSKTL
eukprot:NODE_27_length_39007_cov_1.590650.p25 type:complete len:170 gc:universal NODE_27_length_39007_cov_1.590650:14761-15270(+)